MVGTGGAAEGMAVVLFGVKDWRFDGSSMIQLLCLRALCPGALSAGFSVVALGLLGTCANSASCWYGYFLSRGASR